MESPQLLDLLVPIMTIQMAIIIFTTAAVGGLSILAICWLLNIRNSDYKLISNEKKDRTPPMVGKKSEKARPVVLDGHSPSRIQRTMSPTDVRQIDDLSTQERLEELRARSDQLAAIHALMRDNPQHYGNTLASDIHSQMTTFYAANSA